jgi:hypothetical protein
MSNSDEIQRGQAICTERSSWERVQDLDENHFVPAREIRTTVNAPRRRLSIGDVNVPKHASLKLLRLQSCTLKSMKVCTWSAAHGISVHLFNF